MTQPIDGVFNRLAKNAYILLPLASLFWAGNFVIGRGMRELIPPLSLAASSGKRAG